MCIRDRYSGTRFNEPLYNEVLDITNHFVQPGQNYSKMYGTEPRFNELVIKNAIHKRKREIYLNITSKCPSVIKDEYQTELNRRTRIIF